MCFKSLGPGYRSFTTKNIVNRIVVNLFIRQFHHELKAMFKKPKEKSDAKQVEHADVKGPKMYVFTLYFCFTNLTMTNFLFLALLNIAFLKRSLLLSVFPFLLKSTYYFSPFFCELTFFSLFIFYHFLS